MKEVFNLNTKITNVICRRDSRGCFSQNKTYKRCYNENVQTFSHTHFLQNEISQHNIYTLEFLQAVFLIPYTSQKLKETQKGFFYKTKIQCQFHFQMKKKKCLVKVEAFFPTTESLVSFHYFSAKGERNFQTNH